MLGDQLAVMPMQGAERMIGCIELRSSTGLFCDPDKVLLDSIPQGFALSRGFWDFQPVE